MYKDFFKRGVAEIIDQKSFESKLKSGKKLRIKYGVDPTKPDIHLGHAVGLRKLRALQDEGHIIIFLIGDYTTKIGDPSGRNTTRPVLTDAEIKVNAKTYLEQVGKILDIKKTEVRYNSEWYSKIEHSEFLELASKFTLARIIERDDFEKRLKEGVDIGIHEIIYPLMQAYDSVKLKADVEFGGADQKFNMLAGRGLQKKMGQIPQDIFIVRLLVGLDGKIKMSKSADNYIAITENPNSMFGKVMSIPDSLIEEYFELCTDVTESKIAEYEKEIKAGKNPMEIKTILAKEIVEFYHGKEAAKKTSLEFTKVFSKKELPSDIPVVKIEYGNYGLPLLLINLGAVSSNGEARRVIEQGGVKIDNAKITDPKAEIAINKGMVIQVGKRKVYKIK